MQVKNISVIQKIIAQKLHNNAEIAGVKTDKAFRDEQESVIRTIMNITT